MRTIVNKPKTKICDICNGSFSLYAFSSHLKFSHSITSDEYAAKFGEFRKIKPISTRVIKKLTCAICGKEYSSVGMFAHIRDTHQITKEDYVTKFGEYNSRKEKLDVVSAGESGDITCSLNCRSVSTIEMLCSCL